MFGFVCVSVCVGMFEFRRVDIYMRLRMTDISVCVCVCLYDHVFVCIMLVCVNRVD